MSCGNDDVASIASVAGLSIPSQRGTGALRKLLASVNAIYRTSIAASTSAEFIDNVSIANTNTSSRETGKGGAALQALLSSIPTSGQSSLPKVPRSITRTVVNRPPRNEAFLTMVSRGHEIDEDSDEVSDVSSVSSAEDEVSVATSAVGKAALRMLLSSVSETVQDTETKKPSKRKRCLPPVSRKRKLETVSIRDRRPQISKHLRDKKLHSSNLDDNVSTASSKHFGKAALDHLLAQVNACEDDTDN